ncbi:MAG: hypothetical protein LBJ74_04590 [Heliobacteriaceae bacterium]|jgi:hypothetical protein|nr:hypothetical protein [Heliobacteriaceae bacterium]
MGFEDYTNFSRNLPGLGNFRSIPAQLSSLGTATGITNGTVQIAESKTVEASSQQGLEVEGRAQVEAARQAENIEDCRYLAQFRTNPNMTFPSVSVARMSEDVPEIEHCIDCELTKGNAETLLASNGFANLDSFFA